MSVVLTTTIQGYGWNSGELVPSDYPYIGPSSNTKISFSCNLPLREVSITFTARDYGNGVPARYALHPPERVRDTDGTEFTISSRSTTITIEGTFLPGVSYALWMWGKNSSGFTAIVDSSSGSGELGGLGHIDGGAEYENYIPYLDNGSEWEQLMPYEDNGSSWEVFV